MDLIESYRDELRLIRKPWTRLWVGLLIVGSILLPWVAPHYLTYLGTLIAIYAIGTMGQNLLIGYTGQVSFGQAGFLAVGAYSFAHLVRAGVPVPLSVLGGGLAAAIFGIPVGFPSLRLKGPYLAVVTLGFGIAVYQIFANSEVISGGRMGLAVPKLDPHLGIPKHIAIYYIHFLLALLFTLASYNLVASYMGRAFVAIRDNDIAAESMGVNLTRYKLTSFAISSFYTGIQGALYAQLMGYLEPNMFTYAEAINLLVAVTVGGLASVEGSIFGAAFVILIPQIFSGYKEFIPVVFGVTVFIVLIFEPLGLSGRWLKMRFYMRNWPFR